MSATLPAPDRLDPADAWRPWAPTPADPWSRKWAAHLFRRAAFGPSRDDLAAAEKLGPAGTLDLLMTGRPGSDVTARTLADIGRVAAGRGDNGEQLRGWWLYAMLHGGHPLREKLTLFWHTHFATSINKVRDAAVMFRQNELFRTHALGTFGPLLQAVGRDPAMLVWLDSNSNVKGKPNENYAREVMELFALGVGNYTETDIREAARAFTGWHTDGDAFRFNAALHDDGPKTVFGKTGNWDGGDVVRLVLERPACAKFLVGKLYTFLVSEEPPPAALLDPLADTFRKSDYDVAALVRTVLGSRLFYSEHAFRKRIKGPVEYVLGAVQAVYRRLPETDPEYRPVPQQVLVRRLAAMGQVLFAPPNVKGWPGGRAWLNTATVLERSNFAAALASGALWAEA
ncbi:MAG: DUF1800 domain-containing protein, partial [Gemmataceae bacterium]|nr:DUF1800 domain-containing protein [Gemmataceae bacterium]